MFKENRDFWLYILGTIVCFLLLYFVLSGYKFPFVGFLLDGEEPKDFVYEAPPEMAIDTSKNYRADIVTNRGTITVDLYEKNAPKTVNNFVFLANEGYYNEVKFHRVVNDFLVQTGSRNTLDGDSSNDPLGEPGYNFEDEINWDSLGLSTAKQSELEDAGYSNDGGLRSRPLQQYSLAMANAGPDTNGSQFFIVTAQNNDPRLNTLEGRHTVFGSVIDGFDALQEINSAPIDNNDPFVSNPKGDYHIVRIRVYSL